MAAESADAVMGGTPGRVCRSAKERGNLCIRQAAHMVIGNRLPLLGWERTERRPQATVCWFPGIGGGAGLHDFRYRRRPAGLGTELINCLVVGDRDQPGLDIGAIGEIWIRA